MSNTRIAVIGASQLDPDYHIALNELSDQGRVSAFALDADADHSGFSVLESAMQNGALDAIMLTGPRTNLREWAVFALQHGWPVLATHAVASSIEDMIEIRRAEQSHPGAKIQFGLTARYHESVQVALAKRDTGEYGKLLTMRGVCGCSAHDLTDSVVFDLGPQMVDLMQLFAGPFQEVTGYSDLDRSPNPGSETNVFATLRTHEGILGSLHLSASQWRPVFRLELGFERGYMRLEGLNSQRQHFGQEVLVYARSDGASTRHETVEQFDQSHGAKAAIEAFLQHLTAPNKTILNSSNDAFDTLNTIQRILAADPIFAPLEERHVS
jgi:predicted dehydrogenase